MFLGCLGYFCSRFFPLSWEHHANMQSWHNSDNTPDQDCYNTSAMVRDCQTDIAMTAHQQTNCLRFTQRSANRHYHHDTSQDCSNTAAVSLRAARQVEIVTTHPAKSRHLSIRNWQRWHRLHTVTHPKLHVHRPHALTSTWDCRKHILLKITKRTRQDTSGDISNNTPL